MTLDANLALFLNGLTGQSAFFDNAVVFFASYLPWLSVAFFLLWFYFSSSPAKEKMCMFLTVAASALIARFGAVEIIRFFYHRPRPFSALDIHPLFLDGNWSFPSGHADFFFALSAAAYSYDKKLGVWLFAAAILISIGRVIAGAHYLSDILGGMVLGILVALAVRFFSGRIRASAGNEL